MNAEALYSTLVNDPSIITLNLVIEYDETHHRYSTVRDKNRQEEIINALKCRFVRITPTMSLNEVIHECKQVF